MQAYCMKCRARREMKEAKSITMKNGELAAPGVGPDVRRQDAQNREELKLVLQECHHQVVDDGSHSDHCIRH